MYKFTNQELVNDVVMGIRELFSGYREKFWEPTNIDELTEKYGPIKFVYTNYTPKIRRTTIPANIQPLSGQNLPELLRRNINVHEGFFFLAHLEKCDDKEKLDKTQLLIQLTQHRAHNLLNILSTKSFITLRPKFDSSACTVAIDWVEDKFAELSAIVLPRYQGFESVIEIYVFPDDFAETKNMLDAVFQKMIDKGGITLSMNQSGLNH